MRETVETHLLWKNKKKKQHYRSYCSSCAPVALAFLPSRASVALNKSAKSLSTNCANCLRRPRVTRYGRSLWCKAASLHQLMSTPPSLVILPVVTAAHVPAAVATTAGPLFGLSRVRLGEQLPERTRATSTLPYHVRRMFCPWATECANHHMRCNLRSQRLKTTDTDMFEMTSQHKEVARHNLLR